ncbi:MAG: phenylalanine--tRNA ligase beta subunit-related protein [bacterium]
MRIPALWLSDYLTLDKSLIEVASDFTTIGLMLDKPIENQVLDLEQRLNRSDLLSILGCARDLAVFQNTPLKEPKVKLHKALPKTAESEIKIIVQTPIVRRFNTRVFTGIKVTTSPSWLKKRLVAYGIESINNIVDITNFCMLELGQPMHAQDLNKFKSPDITLRLAKPGEKLTTLLGTTVKLDADNLVLTSGGEVTVVGGIVGGKKTGVTNQTTDIILDAGNYDPRAIRSSSRKLKIINETVTRYDKPLDPRLCEIALNRATDLILSLAGGSYHQNTDYYPRPVAPQSLSLSFSRLKLISGLEIPPKKVKSILQALGYTITDETGGKLILEVPYYRTDLEVEDDLVSDVLRMLNYNTIPQVPLLTSVPPEITSPLYRFEEELKDLLVSMGAHEHLTDPLLPSSGLPHEVVLANAQTTDQNALRTSILHTLAPIPSTYLKHGLTPPIIFEIGKVFEKKGRGDKYSDYQETSQLGVISSSPRTDLATLLSGLGITNYRLLPLSPGQVTVQLSKESAGILTAKSFTLSTAILKKHSTNYSGVVSSYTPTTSFDISLTLPKNIFYSDLEPIIKKTSPTLQTIEVIEERSHDLLLRLTWKKLTNKETEKAIILQALEKIHITSRSNSGKAKAKG